MLFLLDTNVISDLMKRRPLTVARLGAIGVRDQAIICPIVRGEIFYGISRLSPGRWRDELHARANGVLASISCDPMPSGVADQYAEIKRAAELAGTPVADNDLWIAATAANLGATLVTRDLAFRHITSLVIQDWSI